MGLVAGVPTGAGAAPAASGTAASSGTARPAAEVVRYGQPSLYAENIDTMLDFYRDAFGFRVDFRYPGTGAAVFGTVSLGDSYFLTFATYEVIKDSTPLRHIGPAKRKQGEIVVIGADVDALYAKALKAGAKSLMAPRDQAWGERSAYVADPEGNLVQLSTHHGD
ncbi:hypothetical protein GCM10009863_09320 [Streptomyces axinellae]|uniref:VOC domain-containing protein n=1 Tax=Streptomyces axinellae TaxID=552788 RepID=A0ABN3PQR9_9ACTN